MRKRFHRILRSSKQNKIYSAERLLQKRSLNFLAISKIAEYRWKSRLIFICNISVEHFQQASRTLYNYNIAHDFLPLCMEAILHSYLGKFPLPLPEPWFSEWIQTAQAAYSLCPATTAL